MKEPSQITACIIDPGLFLPLAVRLAPHYKRVLFHNPVWSDGFPTLNKWIIGAGFDNVEQCEDFWPLKDEIDLFVFPDIGRSGLQLELESQGKLVWGSRTGDGLEINRQKFLDVLEDVGLQVPDYKSVIGLSALREYLNDKTDKYIKISKFRGTMETTHWRDSIKDGGWLDWMAVKLGPARDLIRFLVFEPIETDLEIGGDTYCIDGQYPEFMVNGLEWKDKGYFGAVTKSDEMPDEIKAVHEAFSPELKSKRYRNFISSEIRRVSAEEFYFIDPTRRFPCPPSSSEMALYGNLPEIILAGAEGEMVQPEMTAQYSAECVLTAKGEKQVWTVVDFSKDIQEHVNCGNCCRIDDNTCFPPDESHGEEIGWLVATGDTPEEVVELMLERAKMLPDGVTANTDSLVDLLKEMRSAQEQGVPIGEKPAPEPAMVIED